MSGLSSVRTESTSRTGMRTRDTDSTSWRRRRARIALVPGVRATLATAFAVLSTIGAPKAASETVPAGVSSVDADAPLATILDGRLAAGRERAVAAQETRLEVYAEDLARRAASDGYMQPVGRIVTPSEIGGGILVGSAVTVLLLLVALRALAGRGWGTSMPRRERDEMIALEERVLAGLREIETRLDRLVERMAEARPSAAQSSPRDGIVADDDGDEPVPEAAPAGSPSDGGYSDRLGMLTLDARRARRAHVIENAPAGHGSPGDGPTPGSRRRGGSESDRRRVVMSMLERGVSPEEIGRRTSLGPAEVRFIMKLAGSRG